MGRAPASPFTLTLTSAAGLGSKTTLWQSVHLAWVSLMHVRPCKVVPMHCIRFARSHSAIRVHALEAAGKPARAQRRRGYVQHGHVARRCCLSCNTRFDPAWQVLQRHPCEAALSAAMRHTRKPSTRHLATSCRLDNATSGGVVSWRGSISPISIRRPAASCHSRCQSTRHSTANSMDATVVRETPTLCSNDR